MAQESRDQAQNGDPTSLIKAPLEFLECERHAWAKLMHANIQMAQKTRDQAQEGDPTSLITATLKGRQVQAIF